MQGNLFPGSLMRLSLVPPCLKTGTNFGLTAFVAALHRLFQLGKLGSTIVRQTDSGSDNDSCDTHALHCALVHFGVVQKIVWIRLMPKHSHDLADRVNSMVGEKIDPIKGVGGVCDAPWDMEDIIKRAIASQSGHPEMAWHWCNWDWREWIKGHIQREFKDVSHMRYWVYEDAPGLAKNGGVRVIYKANLLPHPGNSREPEFKPIETAPDGFTLRTNAEGQDIMNSYPSLDNIPPMEPWKPANPSEAEGVSAVCWKRDKVFSDILGHTATRLRADAQAQWRALKSFHDSFHTSDTVPPLPINVNEMVMEHGVPVSWSAMWNELAWRYKR
eukprot:6204249-Pleurochrysis_carterae.AAC.2